MRAIGTIAAISLMLGLSMAAAQTTEQPPSAGQGSAAEAPAATHLEKPEDQPAPATPVPLGGPVRPRTQVIRGPYVSVQVNVNSQGNNIPGDAANEPSIAVNPTAQANIVIGWRQFDAVASNFRQAGYAYSQDSGETWTFPGVLEPGVFRSDPVLDADGNGVIYYYSLRGDAGFPCQLFRSFNGGQDWQSPVPAHGGDKGWMVVDRSFGPGRGNIYANWTRGISSCAGQFTASYDGGSTFIPCLDIPGSPQWGTLAVGPDSEVYVAGIGFIVAKSSTIHDPLLPPDLDFVQGVNLDGSIVFGGGPNPGGLLGQAWIAVDYSSGPTRGYVYLLASVNRFSTPDPMDVMFARSTDGGLTWSDPVRINDDATDSAFQWFGTMSVAPNGRIDVIWNDTRANPGTYHSELYYAYSLDAGATWSPNEPVSPAFDPHLGWPNQNKIGDYYDMVSDNAGAHVAYSATFNNEQDVYYLRIRPADCNGNGIDDTDEIAAQHNCCEFGNGVGCSDPEIEACVCAIDPYCCNVEWDRLCADRVTREGCGICPAEDCNNNEVPDDCEADCNDNDIADACELTAEHHCCEPGIGPGCDDAVIQDCVCALDPYCCEVEWDERCARSVSEDRCGICPVPDCNHNGQPDECDLAHEVSADCNTDGVPDECAVAQDPVDVLICPGETAIFSAQAAQSGFGYQWRRNGVPLSNGGRFSGATSDTLMVADVEPADAGDLYSCEIHDGCTLAVTGAAALDVIVFGQITRQPVALRYACAGEGTVLGIEYAGGSTPPTYQWFADGQQLVNSPKYGNVQTTSLQINDVSHSDEGIAYTCVVSNPCQSVESDPGTIRVATPEIVQQPADDCGELGETVVLSVEATAPLAVYYQWRKDDMTVENGPTLTLADLEATDAGEYRALAFTLSPTCIATSATALVQVGNCPTCTVPGDLDSDGDVDLVDIQAFMVCYDTNVLNRPGCACANVADVDWIVDSNDWRELDGVVTGPK